MKSKLLLKKYWIACFICINFISINIPVTVPAKEITDLSIGETYNGFKLMSEKKLLEINSKAIIFLHVKSGAHLLYLENDDENKVFSINFYTPPSDDKGANHIIEHSVLYGSEKYSVKSPLMQVMKDSVSNYANAMTFSDRTSYPFATNNSKDFRNLMGIYMDAVFYPNFRKDSKIFSQEGWHYDLASKDSDLIYNGVVYNEMKGNYSSPNVILQDTIMKSLFPDSSYNFQSGGDPKVIPQLTRDKALETYHKYYTPSNSYIYLYGKLDILDNLKFLDNGYLSKFHKKDVYAMIPAQQSFSQRQEKDAEYAVTLGSDTKNKTYLSLNYIVKVNKNMDDRLGLELLNLMLFNSNTSVISNEIIQNGLGSSVESCLDTSLEEPVFQITANGADAKNKDKYTQLIDSAFANIVKNGIDKRTVDAAFNLVETSLRAQKIVANRGLEYGENAIASWLYTGDPTTYLCFEQNLANIKNSINDGYFKKLVQKYFLDNKHSSLVVLKPKGGLQEEVDSKIKKDLADYKSKLSMQAIEDLVKQTKELKTWQNTPDSKKALATMPTLLLSDIDISTKTTPQFEKNIDNVKILEHPMFTNKLAYMNMYFDSSTVPQDKLEYLYLLSNILGRVDTQKYKASEVYNELLNVGGVSFTPSVISKFKDNTVYYPKFVVACSTLTDNLASTNNLISELINNSKLDNKPQLKNLVKSIKEGMLEYIANAPNSVSESRIQSYLSPLGRYNDVGGLKFYDFISDLDVNFDAKADNMINNLETVARLVFNKENLIVGVTIDGDEYNKFEQSLTNLINKIPDKKLEVYNYKFDTTCKNEGLIIPSQVQYIAMGYDINKLGYKYSGSMEVLGKILTTEYLMNEVREKGGAYGTTFSISQQGTAIFSSYRDPNLKETLKVFDKSAGFLKNFKADNSRMTSYILGLINSKDALQDPSIKGATEDCAYISGKTKQDVAKIFEEILNTKAEDIKAYAQMMDDIAKQNVYCVVGGSQKLQKNKEVFNKIIDVISSKVLK